MEEKINAGIIGAGGLVAEKLIGLLLNHRKVDLSTLVSDTFTGKSAGEVHKKYYGRINLKMSSYNPEKLAEECNVIFIIKHHAEAIKKTAEVVSLIKRKDKKVVIDFSADFRLKDIQTYKKWYGFEGEYPSEILKDAVYGLSEIYREKIKSSYFIANPGCYPTGVILALAPVVKEGIVNTEVPIIVNSYSGVSGAGISQKNIERNLAVNVFENIFPYSILTHRHIPEIEQELNTIKSNKIPDIKSIFIPHIVGFKYGIVSTIYFKILDMKIMNDEELFDIYNSFYSGSPFVRIYPPGMVPQLQNVVGTNYCDIGFKVDSRTGYCILISMIDNMIKGAAGQAVQNMNIAFGFDEKEGLLS